MGETTRLETPVAVKVNGIGSALRINAGDIETARTTRIGDKHNFSEKAKQELNTLYYQLPKEDRENLITLLASSKNTKDLENVISDLSHILSMRSDQFSGIMRELGEKGMQQRLVSDALKSFIDNDQGNKANCCAASALKGIVVGDNKSLFTKVLRDIVDNGVNDRLMVPLPNDTMSAFGKSGYQNLSSYLFQTWFMNASTGGAYNVATDSATRAWEKDVLGASSGNNGGLWSQELRAGLELLFQSKVKEFEDFNSSRQQKDFGEAVTAALKAGLPVVAGTKGLALEGYPAENHAVSILQREVGSDGKFYLTIKDTRNGFKLDKELKDFVPVDGKSNEYRVEESKLFAHLNFVYIPEGVNTAKVTYTEGSPIKDPESLIEIQQYIAEGGKIPPEPGSTIIIPKPTLFTLKPARNRDGNSQDTSVSCFNLYDDEHASREPRNRFVVVSEPSDTVKKPKAAVV